MEPQNTTMPGDPALDAAARERFQAVAQWLEQQIAASGLGRKAFARVEECIQIIAGLRPRPPHDPLQNPTTVYFPGLTATPFHDSSQFKWTPLIEGAYPTIQRELLELLNQSEGFKVHDQSDKLIKEGSWKEYAFYSNGKRNDENCARCPDTAKLLDSLPRKTPMGSVKFSIAAPGTHIEPHCAPNNLRIRCHLGLIVPEGCEIRVGNEVRAWQEGKCLVLDDSFDHEVWNRSDRTRIILLIDFWHQDLTDVEIKAVEQLRKLIRTN